MITLKPMELTTENFTPFGRFYNLREKPACNIGHIKTYLTSQPPIAEPLHLGMTSVKGGNFVSKEMERHVLGEEILICGDTDMILTVANSDSEKVPLAQDVKCFYMHPGDLVVLNKGTWHDANHGVTKDTLYYFFAQDTQGKPNRDRETQWVPISPEPVNVTVI